MEKKQLLNQKVQKTNLESEDVLFMRDLIYSKVPSIRHLSYEEQATLINNEFNSNITGRDLWILEEPTLDQDTLDIRLIYERNIR